MNRNIRIKDVKAFLALILLLKPVGLDHFSPLTDSLMDIFKLLAMLYLLICLLKMLYNRKELDVSILFLLAIEGLTVLSCVLNVDSPYTAVLFWQTIISVLILGETYYEDEIWSFIDVSIMAYKIYIWIDLISIITWGSGFEGTKLHFLGNKNMHILYILPMLMMLLLQTVHYSRRKYSLKNIGWISVSIFIVFKTGSSTSVISLVLFLLFYILVFKGIYSRIFRFFSARAIGSVIAIAGIVIVLAGTTGILTFLVTEVLGKDFTLTGRIYIWPRAIQLIRENPLGLGWNATVTHISGGEFWLWRGQEAIEVGHAHNLWLTIGYKCGLVTLAVYICYIALIGKRLDRNAWSLESDVLCTLKMFYFIFLMIAIVDAYPANNHGLYLVFYLTTRLLNGKEPVTVKRDMVGRMKSRGRKGIKV